MSVVVVIVRSVSQFEPYSDSESLAVSRRMIRKLFDADDSPPLPAFVVLLLRLRRGSLGGKSGGLDGVDDLSPDGAGSWPWSFRHELLDVSKSLTSSVLSTSSSMPSNSPTSSTSSNASNTDGPNARALPSTGAVSKSTPDRSASSDGRATSAPSTASAYASTCIADGRIRGSDSVMACSSVRTSLSTVTPPALSSRSPEISASGLPTQRGSFFPVAHW
mmetsp:Transcript_2513/g.7675  ORF Transcript_2513/g.7675 Transcript_2513/m.7675 type:complete len:219 (+) Transcript_2513:975-1631(+)